MNELTLLLQDTVTGIIQNTMKWILAYVFCGLAAVALSVSAVSVSLNVFRWSCRHCYLLIGVIMFAYITWVAVQSELH